MYARALRRPLAARHSFFLFGPRGTGKTTWLKQRLPGALYLDLLDSGLYVDLLARPQRLGELIPPAYDGWVVLDEIQRIPMLLNEVHRLIEARRIPFAMTGSSARSLRRRGVNLLAGRAPTYRMHPLTAGELGADFDPAAALRYGHLPAVRSEPDPDAYLASYVETYLREEVLQEGLTRNLAAFSRFLEAASFSQAAPLNVAAVARDAGMERRTVANYFQVLEDLLLAWRLPPFTRRAARRLTGHPKFFLFDAGVYRRLRPRGPLDRPEGSRRRRLGDPAPSGGSRGQRLQGARLRSLPLAHRRGRRSGPGGVRRARPAGVRGEADRTPAPPGQRGIAPVRPRLPAGTVLPSVRRRPARAPRRHRGMAPGGGAPPPAVNPVRRRGRLYWVKTRSTSASVQEVTSIGSSIRATDG